MKKSLSIILLLILANCALSVYKYDQNKILEKGIRTGLPKSGQIIFNIKKSNGLLLDHLFLLLPDDGLANTIYGLSLKKDGGKIFIIGENDFATFHKTLNVLKTFNPKEYDLSKVSLVYASPEKSDSMESLAKKLKIDYKFVDVSDIAQKQDMSFYLLFRGIKQSKDEYQTLPTKQNLTNKT